MSDLFPMHEAVRSVPLKPLVLLDVDGVVNAWPDNGSERHSARLNGYRVFVGDDTLEALKAVFGGAHEVLWCSAWRESANEFMPLLAENGVTDPRGLDWITDGHTMASGGFTVKWKFYAIQAHVKVQRARAEGRPIFWIEDFGFGIDEHHTAAHYTDILEVGITPIDTAKEGKLLVTHLERTPFEVKP